MSHYGKKEKIMSHLVNYILKVYIYVVVVAA